MTEENPTGMYEVLDAIEEVIKAADPAKREALADIIDAYSEDFPEDFYWAVGPQSPSFLSHLLTTIDGAAREKGASKSRVFRLVDRKPEGSA